MHYYDIGVPTNIPSSSGRYTYHSENELKIGQFVEIPFGKKQLSGVVLEENTEPELLTFKTKGVSEVISEESWPEQLAKLAPFIAEEYAAPVSTALRTMLPGKLHQRRTATRKPAKSPITERRNLTETTATDVQQRVIDNILAGTGYVPHLLHGETGSGKTLVYKKLIDECLRSGKQALVIVPEISLTPQLEADLRSGLQERHTSTCSGDPGGTSSTLDLLDKPEDDTPVLVLHSTLTESAKYKSWKSILELAGKPCLVVGTRSALFAPLHDIGLVIVDECHDESLNQTGALPYAGLTVAAKLAKLHNCPLVIGSATPKIADYHTFLNNKFMIHDMPVIDASAREQTPITVVDMSADDARHHQHTWLSKKLFQNLTQVVESGGQAMIFLNRRGTARVVACENCGWIKNCAECELGMIYHHDINKMTCHSCGKQEPLASSCPECGQADVTLKAHGTKRLAADLAKLYPGARIARIDSDTPESENITSIYNALHDGTYNIIVGTQIVTKGLDLPNLELVGVVSADSTSFLPDYRAEEMMFDQLHQVTGRVGRSKPGHVIIQTLHKDSPVLKAIVARDYRLFYEAQIVQRGAHQNPPFTNLARLVISDKNQSKAVQLADSLYSLLNKKSPKGLTFTLPVPCFYEKLSGKYRWQITLKSTSKKQLRDVRIAVESLKLNNVLVELFNVGTG
jgi:primosomal protein N' (replication factor Y) (superfamily II helicase)